MIYDAFNYAVFDQIPPDASTILDVGCGSGTLGKKLKENRDCQVGRFSYESIRLSYCC